MASISRHANGTRLIQFTGANGNRETLRLGKVTQKQAETAKLHVEHLIGCRITGASPRSATAEWIAGLPRKVRGRLARFGLVEARADISVPTLEDWLTIYIDGRSDVKAQTRVNYDMARVNLIEFFGKETALDQISASATTDFRIHLKTVRGLAEGTVRRRCGRAKQFFAAAVKRKLISENPFADIKCSNYAEDRFHYVTRDDAHRIIDACPDTEWRLIFALARFGGIRVPSEILRLKWGHVDWERMQFKVESPKTEHHAGRSTRRVPIFPELYPFLQEAFEAAEPGTEFIISRYRKTSVNLRTQLGRIVAKAGLELWPKPFVNLRSSRETELVESFPLHVVTGWLGNSPEVAKRHYLQVTDEHFKRAVAQHDESEPKALQNALQYVTASARTGSQSNRRDLAKSAFGDRAQRNATPCETSVAPQSPRVGLEPTT